MENTRDTTRSIRTCSLSFTRSPSLRFSFSFSPYHAAFTVLPRLEIIAWLADAFRTGCQGNYCSPAASLWKRAVIDSVLQATAYAKETATAADIQMRPANTTRLKRFEVSRLCLHEPRPNIGVGREKEQFQPRTSKQHRTELLSFMLCSLLLCFIWTLFLFICTPYLYCFLKRMIGAIAQMDPCHFRDRDTYYIWHCNFAKKANSVR